MNFLIDTFYTYVINLAVEMARKVLNELVASRLLCCFNFLDTTIGWSTIFVLHRSHCFNLLRVLQFHKQFTVHISIFVIGWLILMSMRLYLAILRSSFEPLIYIIKKKL